MESGLNLGYLPMQEASIPHIGLLLPPDFATLSFAPLAVFETANMVLGEPLYEVHVVTANGGQLRNSFGMTIETESVSDFVFDTIVVGAPPDARRASKDTLAALSGGASRYRRIASICVGAFILGEAGLLDGRRSTTHWMFGQELQARHPKTRVEVDRMFIADGPIWTSAGMTAGIDMALGLIERDIGRNKARETARTMVVHHRRAGGQLQHSALLDVEGRSDRVQHVLDYVHSHLDADLAIDRLAEIACLSVRQFSRLFATETGVTPARAIENLRLEKARFLLEQGRLPIEEVAVATGFGDRERMRRSFLRSYGQTPRSVRSNSPPLAVL
jgi:transcriptional regulator GlxA family with amidase domain